MPAKPRRMSTLKIVLLIIGLALLFHPTFSIGTAATHSAHTLLRAIGAALAVFALFPVGEPPTDE